MREILNYLPILAILIASNILLGTVYNTSIEDMTFSKEKLLNGLKKALSIAIAFIGLAYTFDVVDIGGDILTPQLIMTSAIATYAGKVVIHLTKILGISQKNNLDVDETDDEIVGNDDTDDTV